MSKLCDENIIFNLIFIYLKLRLCGMIANVRDVHQNEQFKCFRNKFFDDYLKEFTFITVLSSVPLFTFAIVTVLPTFTQGVVQTWI